MGFQVKGILLSVSEETNAKLTTLQLTYPRFIHAELMTHREFSRNASSSRAIPVAKMIEQVRNDPAMPIHWGANQPGMQAENKLDPMRQTLNVNYWLEAAEHAANVAEKMSALGLHKQVANRVLEPFQWMHTIVTTASFSNWNGLRRHKDAQPEIKHLADLMAETVAGMPQQVLKFGEWHLPYIVSGDWEAAALVLKASQTMPSEEGVIEILRRVSAARCARVSYLTHDGQTPSLEQDLQLFERLAGAQPIHASPLEHQATPDVFVWNSSLNKEVWQLPEQHGNLPGWIQHRKLVKGEYIH